jgi:hypothetical protein
VTRERIVDVTRLARGDHICWHRWYGIFHHAIFLRLTDDGKGMEIVDYGDNNVLNPVVAVEKNTAANVSKSQPSNVPMYTVSLGSLTSTLDQPQQKQQECQNTSDNAAIVRKRTTGVYECNNKFLYRYVYEDCYDPEYVVHRAQTLIGETDFDILQRNCEHSSRWCKTGLNDQVEVWGTYSHKILITCLMRAVGLLVLVVVAYFNSELERVGIQPNVERRLERQLTLIFVVIASCIYFIYSMYSECSELHPVAVSRNQCEFCENCRCARAPNCTCVYCTGNPTNGNGGCRYRLAGGVQRSSPEIRNGLTNCAPQGACRPAVFGLPRQYRDVCLDIDRPRDQPELGRSNPAVDNETTKARATDEGCCRRRARDLFCFILVKPCTAWASCVANTSANVLQCASTAGRVCIDRVVIPCFRMVYAALRRCRLGYVRCLRTAIGCRPNDLFVKATRCLLCFCCLSSCRFFITAADKLRCSGRNRLCGRPAALVVGTFVRVLIRESCAAVGLWFVFYWESDFFAGLPFAGRIAALTAAGTAVNIFGYIVGAVLGAWGEIFFECLASDIGDKGTSCFRCPSAETDNI